MTSLKTHQQNTYMDTEGTRQRPGFSSRSTGPGTPPQPSSVPVDLPGLTQDLWAAAAPVGAPRAASTHVFVSINSKSILSKAFPLLPIAL